MKLLIEAALWVLLFAVAIFIVFGSAIGTWLR